MLKMFSELTIKGNRIKNRIVMPPMVCFGWAGNDGFITEEHIKHYEARAKGGTGLIILEAHCISKDGRLCDSQLGIWSDEHIEGLKEISDRCHKYGSKVLVQIHHAGLNTAKNVCETALSPSDFNGDGKKSRALTEQEIHEIQKAYVNAAVRSEKAGLDGIEIHGAHGYLISQFLSPVINKRTDSYGGDIKSRMKFALEIVDQIREACKDNFIIGYRMGGNEPSLDNGISIAKELEKHGVDLLHVSAGISAGELPQVPEGFEYNWIVYCGTEIKKHVSIPVIAVNGIRTPDQAGKLLENGMCDFTAVGKGILCDPEWANKAMAHKPVNTCLGCRHCKWYSDGKKCPRKKAVDS